MDTMKIYPGCQKPLAPNATDGLCLQCLVKASLPTGADIGRDSSFAERFTRETKALSNHDRAIALSPERADYYLVCGLTYQRLKNLVAAIALNPDNQWFCLGRGYNYLALGQPDKAEADFTQSKEMRTKPSRELPSSNPSQCPRSGGLRPGYL